VLVELTKMEQRCDAVLGVTRDVYSVAEVAEAHGVSRQSIHAWLARNDPFSRHVASLGAAVRPDVSPIARLTLRGLEYPGEPGRPGSCGGRSSRSS
jgi:hypothetical protein